jgi:hypothetical protein
LTFNENEIGVLTAVNGRGKTTILSHIVDAWHEMARPYFQNEFEGKENKYYRVSSTIFNINQNESSFVYIRFKTPEGNIDYIDISNNCNEQLYNTAIILDEKIPFAKLKSDLVQRNNIKYVSSNFDEKKANSLFKNNVITYFPSYRYEIPGYINDPYKIHLDFTTQSSFSGYLPNPLEVVSGLPQLANWIMDVVLDMDLYKQTKNIQFPNGQMQSIDLTPERKILWNSLNIIISQSLVSKKYDGTVRFGIGKRNAGGARISIMNDKNINGSNVSEQIYPTIFNLSSGEATMLCLFGEILRQADNNRNNIALQEITGIVLIDEVDKHLHIKLQKEVLPVMFNLFPNIQFIVSSHSPFLNMGLVEHNKIKARTTIRDLDQNGLEIPVQENYLYKEVYEMMIHENENYAKLYKELSTSQNKSILFVEDTYTQIYKVAWLKLHDMDFDENNIDEQFEDNADFHIYGKGNKDNLQGFLNNPCMNEWRNKIIIGLFDFDDAYGNYQKLKDNWEVKSEDETNGLYKKRIDCNVYALMLPIPDFRKNIAGKNQKVNQLEVELLFSDDNIKKIFANSDYATETIIKGLEIPKIKNKKDFWRKLLSLNKSDFDTFQPLFAAINIIFSNNGGSNAIN